MSDEGLKVDRTSAGLVVRLHVQPRAKRCEVTGIFNGALKLRVTAPPVDDAANRAIIDFLSSLLELSKSNLRILAGGRSRDKILQIRGLTIEEFLFRLNRKPS
jgi:uncharacterized protein (TIGR00251 family)